MLFSDCCCLCCKLPTSHQGSVTAPLLHKQLHCLPPFCARSTNPGTSSARLCLCTHNKLLCRLSVQAASHLHESPSQEPLVVLHTGAALSEGSRSCSPAMSSCQALGSWQPACGVALHFLAAPARAAPEHTGVLGKPRSADLDLALRDPWTGSPAGRARLTLWLACLGPAACPSAGWDAGEPANRVWDTPAAAQGSAAQGSWRCARSVGGGAASTPVNKPWGSPGASPSGSGGQSSSPSPARASSCTLREPAALVQTHREAALLQRPSEMPEQPPEDPVGCPTTPGQRLTGGLAWQPALPTADEKGHAAGPGPPGGRAVHYGDPCAHPTPLRTAVRRICTAWVASLVGAAPAALTASAAAPAPASSAPEWHTLKPSGTPCPSFPDRVPTASARPPQAAAPGAAAAEPSLPRQRTHAPVPASPAAASVAPGYPALFDTTIPCHTPASLGQLQQAHGTAGTAVGSEGEHSAGHEAQQAGAAAVAAEITRIAEALDAMSWAAAAQRATAAVAAVAVATVAGAVVTPTPSGVRPYGQTRVVGAHRARVAAMAAEVARVADALAAPKFGGTQAISQNMGSSAQRAGADPAVPEVTGPAKTGPASIVGGRQPDATGPSCYPRQPSPQDGHGFPGMVHMSSSGARTWAGGCGQADNMPQRGTTSGLSWDEPCWTDGCIRAGQGHPRAQPARAGSRGSPCNVHRRAESASPGAAGGGARAGQRVGLGSRRPWRPNWDDSPLLAPPNLPPHTVAGAGFTGRFSSRGPLRLHNAAGWGLAGRPNWSETRALQARAQPPQAPLYGTCGRMTLLGGGCGRSTPRPHSGCKGRRLDGKPLLGPLHGPSGPMDENAERDFPRGRTGDVPLWKQRLAMGAEATRRAGCGAAVSKPSPVSNPNLGSDPGPSSPVGALRALAGELVAGVAELRHLRLALVQDASAGGGQTLSPKLPRSLTGMQAHMGKERGTIIYTKPCQGLSGSKRGRSPAAANVPMRSQLLPQRQGSGLLPGLPRRMAFGRATLEPPPASLGKAARLAAPVAHPCMRQESVTNNRVNDGICSLPPAALQRSAACMPAMQVQEKAVADSPRAPKAEVLKARLHHCSPPGDYAPRYRMRPKPYPDASAAPGVALARAPACAPPQAAEWVQAMYAPGRGRPHMYEGNALGSHAGTGRASVAASGSSGSCGGSAACAQQPAGPGGASSSPMGSGSCRRGLGVEAEVGSDCDPSVSCDPSSPSALARMASSKPASSGEAGMCAGSGHPSIACGATPAHGVRAANAVPGSFDNEMSSGSCSPRNSTGTEPAAQPPCAADSGEPSTDVAGSGRSEQGGLCPLLRKHGVVVAACAAAKAAKSIVSTAVSANPMVTSQTVSRMSLAGFADQASAPAPATASVSSASSSAGYANLAAPAKAATSPAAPSRSSGRSANPAASSGSSGASADPGLAGLVSVRAGRPRSARSWLGAGADLQVVAGRPARGDPQVQPVSWWDATMLGPPGGPTGGRFLGQRALSPTSTGPGLGHFSTAGADSSAGTGGRAGMNLPGEQSSSRAGPRLELPHPSDDPTPEAPSPPAALLAACEARHAASADPGANPNPADQVGAAEKVASWLRAAAAPTASFPMQPGHGAADSDRSGSASHMRSSAGQRPAGARMRGALAFALCVRAVCVAMLCLTLLDLTVHGAWRPPA